MCDQRLNVLVEVLSLLLGDAALGTESGDCLED